MCPRYPSAEQEITLLLVRAMEQFMRENPDLWPVVADDEWQMTHWSEYNL